MHLRTMGLSEGDPTCRFCRKEAETVWHIICCCEVLAHQHFNVFGNLDVKPKYISTASVRDLCLCIWNKPKAEVHTGAIMLTGSKAAAAEEEMNWNVHIAPHTEYNPQNAAIYLYVSYQIWLKWGLYSKHFDTYNKQRWCSHQKSQYCMVKIYILHRFLSIMYHNHMRCWNSLTTQGLNYFKHDAFTLLSQNQTYM
jgi:hypothetical protein